jgi:hypothetical protein
MSTIVVKGSKVIFLMKDGSKIRPKSSFGIIHDTGGEVFDRCVIFVGPYKKTRKKAEKPPTAATRYFGSNYTQHECIVNIPSGPWKYLGEVVQILYERTKGSKYAAKYFHVFKTKSPRLSKCGSYYRLNLQDGCIVDDRGFVFP